MTMDMYFINFKGIFLGVLRVQVYLHIRLCESTFSLENPSKNHFFWYKYSLLMTVNTVYTIISTGLVFWVVWHDKRVYPCGLFFISLDVCGWIWSCQDTAAGSHSLGIKAKAKYKALICLQRLSCQMGHIELILAYPILSISIIINMIICKL